jgi:hypothetical protein
MWLKGDYEFVEIPRDQFDLLDEAVEEMNTPYRSAVELIDVQMKETPEKYQEYHPRFLDIMSVIPGVR